MRQACRDRVVVDGSTREVACAGVDLAVDQQRRLDQLDGQARVLRLFEVGEAPAQDQARVLVELHRERRKNCISLVADEVDSAVALFDHAGQAKRKPLVERRLEVEIAAQRVEAAGSHAKRGGSAAVRIPRDEVYEP